MKTNILSTLTTSWSFLIGSGLIQIGIGIWVLLSPANAYFSLSIILAIGMLVSGLFHLVFSIAVRAELKGWAWLLTGALIDIGLGIYLLYFPMLTMILLPIILGLWLLFRGFMAIGRSVELKGVGRRPWLLSLIPGIVILVCAFIILNNPFLGVINIISLLAIAFIITGIFRIVMSFRVHRSLSNTTPSL